MGAVAVAAIATATLEEAMSPVDRGGRSSTNTRSSSDEDTKAAVALITLEECQGHLSSVGESYLAALSKVKSYEETIAEQQNQIKSLELKLQSSQGQNFKLVQEVIKLSSSGGKGPIGGTISDNTTSYSLLEEGDTTTTVTSNVTMREAKEELSSTSSSTVAVSPQDPMAAQETKDQLQEQLYQLQSEMATVRDTVQEQTCFFFLFPNSCIVVLSTLLLIIVFHNL